MKIAGLSLILCIQLSFQTTAQINPCLKANELISVISKHHIQPIPVNDTWAKRVFESLFTRLDPDRVIFTKEDIRTLEQYQNTLDDLIQSNNCSWLSSISSLYNKRIQEYKTWLQLNLSKPVNFKKAEYFYKDSLSGNYAANTQELEARKRKYIKYEVLSRMYQESLVDVPQKSILTYEPQARQKVKERKIQDLEHILEKAGGLDNYIIDCFYKSIATVYDPHTEYFSFHEAEDFKSALNYSQLSFGFSLTQNRIGNKIVSGIIPGSPAWTSNQLHDGDILLSFDVPGKAMNAMDYSIEELLEILNSNSVTAGTFTVKKSDGPIIKVSLVKEKLESLDNVVDGFSLKGAKNIGYIPLPSFYFDWNESTGAIKGSTTDVAKTIIKLNNEHLDGLILDLRFNGGGSVQEALDLAGIFIDYGPLILYHQTGNPIEVIKDKNKGTIFNGPLIIMINGHSASASELVVSTLQDYNRALVIGTKTFGKGTGQEMFPVKEQNPNSDILKITASKIYRLTGKTYQHEGVSPAIVLPDLISSFSDRESDYTYSLYSDSIAKKAYFTSLPTIAVAPLIKKSAERIGQSEPFKKLELIRSALTQPIPLNPDEFTSYLNGIVTFKPYVTSKIYTVTSALIDNSLMSVDTFKKSRNETLIKEVENSFFIQEAYNIMIDYIATQKK